MLFVSIVCGLRCYTCTAADPKSCIDSKSCAVIFNRCFSLRVDGESFSHIRLDNWEAQACTVMLHSMLWSGFWEFSPHVLQVITWLQKAAKPVQFVVVLWLAVKGTCVTALLQLVPVLCYCWYLQPSSNFFSEAVEWCCFSVFVLLSAFILYNWRINTFCVPSFEAKLSLTFWS